MTVTNSGPGPLVTWADLKDKLRPLKAFAGQDEIALGAAADAVQELLAERGVSTDGAAEAATTTPDAILTDLIWMRDLQPSDTEAQSIRRAAYEDVVKRVAALIAGCTCRPGLVLPSAGCRVEGHDVGWEE